MSRKTAAIAIGLFFLIVLLSPSINAEQDIPIGLQRIIDFNNQSSADFAVKISFFIAFVAGILGILSPCILPFLPAYFSYTFKEKENITKMTLIFFFGFTGVFVIMGAIVGFLGHQTLIVVQSGWLVTIAGLFLLILGFMTLFGKGFSSFVKFRPKFRNDALGTFLFGVFFAIGWTACLGPILAGILGIGAILGNTAYSMLLLFFYSLGNLIPLFILSILYDRLKLSKSRFMIGKTFTLSIADRRYSFHSTNIISGVLFLIIGTVLVIYKGTAIVNTYDIFGTREYFYSIQRLLIEWKYANALGITLFIMFVVLVGLFMWKYHWRESSRREN